MSKHVQSAPLKVPFVTRGSSILMLIVAIGLVFFVIRIKSGIGAITNLDNQYPWGLWIAIDIATGVALAAGGFTTAALAHIFHRERYEPIVRPALLTAMLGYTFVVLGLFADLGRYYNLWHPMIPSMWSGHSVLFEVGICVMFYLTVLYIEFLPMVVERFRGRVNLPGLLSPFNRLADGLLGLFDRTLGRVMSLFIIAGVVLSCMHQSSLGGLLVLAPYKMNQLWWTPIMPLLFLISAICVGFPMVVFESMIASRSFGRKPEMDVLAPLSRITPVLLAAYLGIKLLDLANRSQLGHLFDGSGESILFLLETGIGFVLPMVLLFFPAVRNRPALLFTSATLVVLGVAWNRIDVFLVAYKPVYMTARYVPAVGEIAVTAGLISALILVYRFLSIHLPVLPVEHDHEAKPVGSGYGYGKEAYHA